MNHPDIAVGIGCRKGANGEAIASLVREALARTDEQGSVALFTTEKKQSETGILDAAQRLALPLHFLSQDALQAMSGKTQTRSARVEALFAVPSVSETAALAGAGPDAELLVPRISENGVSCAVAGVRKGNAS